MSPEHVTMTKEKYKAIDELLLSGKPGMKGLILELFDGETTLSKESFINRIQKEENSWIFDAHQVNQKLEEIEQSLYS